ncbi:MAG: FAD:protein FMN transferase [Elusimicrobia bacterium]|nr:FAD:protein FMN transferase [Elusimicrobiota bacterium]
MNKFIWCALALLAAGCGERKEEAAFVQKTFIMSVPAEVRLYGGSKAAGQALAGDIFAEWNRISSEFSYSDPYSLTTLVNKKAYGEWVRVDDEFLRLLMMAMDYYKLSGGAFDITFAPLWPLWKEAASTRKLPAKADIQKALANIGSNYIQIDPARRAVRFTRPVQINLGGLLRGYCFERAYKMLRAKAPDFPVELRLGGNVLVYGKRDWKYAVMDPFRKNKRKGTLLFNNGIVVSSSGRDSFVEIEGKLYSHILDLKTGYPIENFSNLMVYFPGIESNNFLASAVLAVMGKDKAFKLLEGMKGTAAVWLDGAGEPYIFQNAASKAKWEEEKGLF